MVTSEAKEPTYEELRRQRIEENKKRMEELRLPQLSFSLKSSPFPKPSLMKQMKAPPTIQTEIVEARRSGRLANKPTTFHKKTVNYEHSEFAIRYNISSYKQTDLSGVYASAEARVSAALKAEELKLRVGAEYPTLVKPLLQSHVTGTWLGIPSHWSRKYLPKCSETFTLVDEEGKEYPTVYLSKPGGLSGGWKGFSTAHELVDGDALLLQLVQPTTIKVYIIRVNSFEKRKTTLEALDA